MRSKSNSVRAISRGIRPMRRWLASYLRRSPAASAVASELACRNANASPSPVTASTEPDASPTKATRPATTEGSLTDIEIAPRVGPISSAPSRWLASTGNMISQIRNPGYLLCRPSQRRLRPPRSGSHMLDNSFANKLPQNRSTDALESDGAIRSGARHSNPVQVRPSRRTLEWNPSAPTIHRQRIIRPSTSTPAGSSPSIFCPHNATIPTSFARSTRTR